MGIDTSKGHDKGNGRFQSGEGSEGTSDEKASRFVVMQITYFDSKVTAE
jgi:hypothetical protein